MRMNEILDINFPDRCATVQAGVTNIGITNAVADEDFYAPDPSSQLACMIGGNVNMNSGGAHCLKYGVTANNLLGLKIVTVDGQILNIGGEHLDAAGYDWLGLLTGSEGQLALVTEITVRILRSPEGARAMLAGFASTKSPVSARAACTLGAVTRTISHPTSARAIDWRTVAATSCVSLVVIDWTLTGFLPPTATPPTSTSRVGRRTVWNREAQ